MGLKLHPKIPRVQDAEICRVNNKSWANEPMILELRYRGMCPAGILGFCPPGPAVALILGSPFAPPPPPLPSPWLFLLPRFRPLLPTLPPTQRARRLRVRVTSRGSTWANLDSLHTLPPPPPEPPRHRETRGRAPCGPFSTLANPNRSATSFSLCTYVCTSVWRTSCYRYTPSSTRSMTHFGGFILS